MAATEKAKTARVQRPNKTKNTSDSSGRSKATKLDPEAAREEKKRFLAAERSYGRGRNTHQHSAKDKKLRANLKRLEDKYKKATLQAKDAELLLESQPGAIEAEGELERTYKVTQKDIQEEVGLETAKNAFDLKLLDLGPYSFDYTRNGTKLLLAGRKGHVATMDWREGKLGCELQLNETVRDATWLHNDQYFALAQKKYVYIYDHAGLEIHCLEKHREPTHLEFLPYHFLLASVATSGFLKYTDTSTGQLVAELPTRLGSPTSLAQNPSNAILHVGHQNGSVTLWSPNSTSALVKMLPHRGPVRSIAMDRLGNYMVSTGQDQRMAVWDIRMYREVHSYSCLQPGVSVDVSDTGLTAVGWGTQVSVWQGLFEAAKGEAKQKVQSPYMRWGGEGQRIEHVGWCPYEDVLGIGHDQGFSSMVVPGAGEANYDASEANPFETTKQRRETEVRSLLTKLQPDMISLNPHFIGRLSKAQENQVTEAAAIQEKKKKADGRRKQKLQQTQEKLGPVLGRFATSRNI